MNLRFQGNVISHWPRPLQPIGAVLGHIPLSRALWSLFALIFASVTRILWQGTETIRRLRISMTPDARIQRYKELLDADLASNTRENLISVTLPSRKLGNRDCRIEKHLSSFREMTVHPERFEILVKVDDDDDLAFYNRVQKKFADLNLRFFVTPRGVGYGKLTDFLIFLLDRVSPTSKAWLCTWDDHIFMRSGWDLDVYDLIDHSQLFIAGSHPSSSVGTLMTIPAYPEPVQAYECEVCPIISLGFLELLRNASDGLEGWTRLGDLYVPDGFFPSLIQLFREKWGINIYHEIPQYLYQATRAVSWTKNFKRMALYYDAYTKFLGPSAMEVRARVAETMYREAGLDAWPAPEGIPVES